MKLNYFFGALLLSPLLAFASPDNNSQGLIFSPLPQSDNTVVRHYSNEQEKPDLNKMRQRSMDFPTQIVRVSGNLEGMEITCGDVEEEINHVFSEKILPKLFTYNIYINCGYDVHSKEKYAMNFSIQSYFDPLTDEAIDYLKSYLAEYNGYNLFNATTLKIENAKGIIVSMNIGAGFKNRPDNYTYTLYRQDRSNFYFKSNFEMRQELIADIYRSFYSNDPDVILPFFDKWVFSYAGKVYYSILEAANYLDLQPERIFVMEGEGDIFVSGLRYYFANVCMTRHPNKHCL